MCLQYTVEVELIFVRNIPIVPIGILYDNTIKKSNSTEVVNSAC